MISYIEFLKLSPKIAVVIVGLFLVLQIIGELIEAKGKVVPEIMKIRKFFKRRKEEKDTIKQLPAQIKEFQDTLKEFNVHYSEDNITKRDNWMHHVDEKEECYDQQIETLSKNLDKVIHTVVDIQIDNKRSQIIDFARIASDDSLPVTREQFTRILKMYADYERIIKENNMTNGEIEIAYSIITKAYAKHMENHTFVEDLQDQ